MILMAKEKKCNFCSAQFPKTKEHIISRGVLELTINPSEKAIFGPYYNDGHFEYKEFPIKNFVFPACYTCNNYYSNIDGKTKQIFLKILEVRQLDNFDLNNLLIWFDKVRIGLRNALFIMKDQKERILNNFYVNFNIQAKDRLLLIYKNKEIKNDFLVICANTPAFQYTPTCFAIKINNYGFINISEHFLISKKMGLPYAKDISYFNESLPHAITLVKGSKKIEYPILEEEYDKDCAEIYQINLSNNERKSYPSLFNDPYVKSFFINDTSELGKILYYKDEKIKTYPSTKSLEWKPRVEKEVSDKDFLKLLIMQTLRLQSSLILRYPLEVKDSKTFKRMEDRKKIALETNQRMLTNIKYKM